MNTNAYTEAINRTFRKNRDAVVKASKDAQIARRFNNPARQTFCRALQAAKGGK